MNGFTPPRLARALINRLAEFFQRQVVAFVAEGFFESWAAISTPSMKKATISSMGTAQ
jgi:hypothetical protein